MEEIADIIDKLNRFLHVENLVTLEFQKLIDIIINQKNLKFKILYCNLYTEKRLQDVEANKNIALANNEYETAAEWSSQERLINKYMKLKNDIQLQNSMFYYEDGYVFYFYMGTELNDKKLKEIVCQKLFN